MTKNKQPWAHEPPNKNSPSEKIAAYREARHAIHEIFHIADLVFDAAPIGTSDNFPPEVEQALTQEYLRLKEDAARSNSDNTIPATLRPEERSWLQAASRFSQRLANALANRSLDDTSDITTHVTRLSQKPGYESLALDIMMLVHSAKLIQNIFPQQTELGNTR